MDLTRSDHRVPARTSPQSVSAVTGSGGRGKDVSRCAEKFEHFKARHKKVPLVPLGL